MFVCPKCGFSADSAGFCTEDGTVLVYESDPLIGTLVGSYRITKVAGRGGMGVVYLAVQPSIGSRVALKVLSVSHAESPVLVERFFAEARVLLPTGGRGFARELVRFEREAGEGPGEGEDR